jgi:uncharacterized lipoprotein
MKTMKTAIVFSLLIIGLVGTSCSQGKKKNAEGKKSSHNKKADVSSASPAGTTLTTP